MPDTNRGSEFEFPIQIGISFSTYLDKNNKIKKEEEEEWERKKRKQ